MRENPGKVIVAVEDKDIEAYISGFHFVFHAKSYLNKDEWYFDLPMGLFFAYTFKVLGE